MKIISDKNIMAPMRDGVRLAANVMRPDSSTPVPAILLRTPYGKDNDQGQSVGFAPDIMKYVEAGYAAVIQDTRGTFGSEGEFGNFADEVCDGEDTIAWLAEQPWCDGNVGMIGASYLGKTQWQAAKASPPALKAIVPIIAVHDGQRLGWCRDGVPFAYDYAFALMMAVTDAMRAERLGKPSDLPILLGAMQKMDLGHLPFADRPEIKNFKFWRNIIDHADRDDQWRSEAVEDPSAIKVPAFHICGWYDTGNPSFWQLFDMINRGGGSDAAREGQRIIVGPWTHAAPTGAFPGRFFGPTANAQAVDLHGQIIRFFNRWLKGQVDALDNDPPIRLFMMGADEWREYQQWPIPGVAPADYYLVSNGAANSAQGDGLLTLTPSAKSIDDIFVSNPRRPVPTTLSGSGDPQLRGVELPGPYDQRSVEDREDVLCYTTAPLTEPLEVLGAISLKLFVSSSARDTDIVAKLIDVHPDGRAIILTDGICRLRYRNSLSQPELITPGQTYEISIDLAATANVFLPGHRIRVEIAGSSFPRYVRNTNTGGNVAFEGVEDCVVAMNRIAHSAEQASRLVLPVVSSRPIGRG